MAMQTRKQRMSPGAAQRSPLRAATRPIAWSALISSVVLSVAVGPAYATDTTPGAGQVPNAGVRPVADRPLQMPGAVAPAAIPGLSPLAQQLQTKQAEMEQAGERAKQIDQEHREARTNLALATANWRAAGDRLNKARTQVDADAVKAFKVTAGLPPEFTSDLRGFGALSPVTRDDIPGLGSARDLLRAQQEEHDAYQAYLAAIQAEQAKAQAYRDAQAEYQRREAAYQALRRQNADRLASAEREQEQRDQALGRQYIDNGSLNGFAAHPNALRAVNVALAQLGKPYVWGAEGPNSFDCSGLMWYSYLHGAGHNLPRVAKDQYYGTRSRTVSRYALLPGDLLFFATNPNDWTTVHHVGMYLGVGSDGVGKMVHAPHTGDVVKISTVWWSEFFAATRVFPEVVSAAGNGSTPPSGGGGNPAPQPSLSSKPPSPSPSQTSKSPSPTPSSPSPTPSSPSPSPSAPSPTPDPTTSSPSPAATESSAAPAPDPVESNSESTAPTGDGSSAPSTGTSGSSASTEASSTGSESPASTVTSSSGS